MSQEFFHAVTLARKGAFARVDLLEMTRRNVFDYVIVAVNKSYNLKSH